MKIKKGFFCKSCGAEHNQWQGQCRICKEWNTITEEIINKNISKDWKTENLTKPIKPVRMDKIGLKETTRFKTGDNEFDRVLGGGVVPGGVVLLGGEPGIGKSTLLLQIALQLNKKVLYISGEESQQQIKSRAKRMGLNEESCYVLCETEIQLIFLQIQSLTPDIIIVDSIQTLHDSDVESVAGSITQIRAIAAELIRFAKTSNIPVILIGHIGNNPEGRYTPTGISTASFSIATNESWKDQSGEMQDRTEWHRIVMYGRMAETASEYMKKGQMVYVEGRLHTREWEDQNQIKRKTTEIRCDNFTMLGRRSDSPQGTNPENPAPSSKPKSETDGDDDLPF